MDYPLIIFSQTRQNILSITQALSPDQLTFIPQGHKNNILWNLGHVVSIQQLLVYRAAGLPVSVPDSFLKLFKKDTSPADWNKMPDIDNVRTLLQHTHDLFLADYKKRLFTDQPFKMKLKMVYGLTVSTPQEAMLFNNTHEAMHLAIIMGILKHL